ncbi:tetratricopeptide repeat protein [Acidithiobacillus ferrivorans]|nr:tetratricopeptide repeat protein [Acidithiobacillus ferrivorans]
MPSLIENSEPRQVSLAEGIQIALAHHRQGNHQTAEEIYTSVLRADPQQIDAMHLLGVIRCQQGRLDEAEQLLQAVIQRNPESTAFQNTWGRLLLLRGRREEALIALRKALDLSPQNPEAFFNLAEAELTERHLDDAIKHYEQCLVLHPTHPAARFGLAQSIRMRDGWAAAVAHYQLAVANAPDNPIIQQHFATSLLQSGHLDAAQPVFLKITERWLDFVDAWNGQAAIHFIQGRLPESIKAYEKALELQPDNPQALDGLIEARRRACDWRDDIETLEQKLVTHVQTFMERDQLPAIRIFTALYTPFNAEQQLAIARANAQGARPIDAHPRFTDKAYASGRIRVGYMIADVRNHPNAHNTLLLYGLHDREKFEVFVYSWGADDNSTYRHRIRNECEHFIEMRGWSDEAMAQRISDDGVQILVDLMAHTSDNRMGALARRPAPLQINYLGFPGTSGADFIDYILGDPWVTPAESAAAFSERILTLPNSYQINSHREIILKTPPVRKALDLPEDAFVYCCFNTAYKFTPRVFSLWMDILKATPNSVFWTFKSGALVENHLRAFASKQGVDPARLIFGPTLPRDEHIQRIQAADLFLDTELYNAHTTASDSLWAGVPILTVPGNTFASRVCASLVHSAGLDECILPDWDTYKETAVALAKDRTQLDIWRAHLRNHPEKLPVFDTPQLVLDMEKIYQDIWQDHETRRNL